MAFFLRRRSAQSAKERLQLVLVHDRTDLTAAELEALKDDLLRVISQHIEIDPDAVQIAIERVEQPLRKRSVLLGDSAFDQKAVGIDLGYEIIDAVA